MATAGTRESILDAAEILFARSGIKETSLRAITGDAGANLASVHYHFGSKEGLLDAVLERRARPVNQMRVGELKRLTEESPTGVLEIEEILGAYLYPGLQGLEQATERDRIVSRLLVRIEAQPAEHVEELFRKNFAAVNRVFLERLQDALPQLSKNTVAERFRFGLGTINYMFSGNFDLNIIEDHPTEGPDFADRIRHAIHFLAAGLRSPERDATVI
jgi:AcrR family transcriptional regulator